MKRFILKKIVTICILLQGLAGCELLPSAEFASNDKYEYLHSKNGNSMVIEKPLTNANISDFYVLPENTKQPAKVSIKPPVVRE